MRTTAFAGWLGALEAGGARWDPGGARPGGSAFRHARRCFSLRVLPLLAALLFHAAGASAQAPELFTPLPADQLGRNAPPAQTQRLEQLRQRPTTQSLSLVRIDPNALRGDSVRLSIPNAPALTLSGRNQDVRGDRDFTWTGTAAGLPGQAMLVVQGGEVTGTIREGADLYRIEPIGNGVHALIKVDQSRFPPEHPPSWQEKERRGDIRTPTPDMPAARADSPVGIDVLVAYTPSAAAAVSNMTATVALAVAEANQSYQNSQINLRLNLVDSFQLSYTESGKSYDTILADFVANATVNTRRDNAGADVAVLIINQTDYCGLADAIMANASTAFAIVHYDCATGYYSFAHEIGHLQGARHDENHDPGSPFSYGHGYEHPSATASQRFRTIMAYRCDTTDCEPRIQYWSNPNVSYSGVPTGTAATNDNARVLNQTASTVAGFRTRSTSGWHHNDLSAAAGAPAATSNPAGYTWDVDKTQHVVYRGTDNHIHELWFNGAWHHNDLTAAAGGTPAASDPAGYTWDVDKTQHVVYRGSDNHIHELWFNGAWHHNDLTAAAGGTPVASDPAGYTWDVDKTQHVVYRGTDSHIHELWFNGAWHHNDLTAAAGAPQSASEPAGYTWDVDKTQHVVYRGSDNHIHELWFNGAWHHNDLTAAAGAPQATGIPDGYTWDVDKTQHVVYRGTDSHVHELWFNGAWHHNDLTAAGGGTPMAGDPDGYTWDVDKTQHVVYRGTDSHIHELWFNGAWHHNDLTAAGGGTPVAGDPDGYTWDVDKTQHVVHRGTDSHIHELWFP